MTAPHPGQLLRRGPAPVPDGLVDSHLHLAADGAPSPPSPGTPPPLTPDDAVRLLADAGIARAVAFPPLRTHYATANSALRDAAARSGGVLHPAARLGGRRVPVLVPALWSVRRAARSRLVPRPPDVDTFAGYVAAKLAPHLDGVPDEPVLAELRARRLPVVVHAGVTCRPAWIARVLLPRLGGCPVVLAHLGSFPGSAPDLLLAVELARQGRVWLDTSSAWLAGFVALAVREAPGRVLFGSDAPLVAPSVAWQQVAAAVTDDRALQRVARDTAQEVFGW